MECLPPLLLSPFLLFVPCLLCSWLWVVFVLLIVFITQCFWANVPPPRLFDALQLDGSKAGSSFRSDFASGSGCFPSHFLCWAEAGAF